MAAKPEKNFLVGFLIASFLGLVAMLLLFSPKDSDAVDLPAQPVLNDNTTAFRTRLGVKESELEDPLYALRRSNPIVAEAAEATVLVRNSETGREGQGVLIGQGNMVLTTHELIGSSGASDVVYKNGEVILAQVQESRKDLGLALLVLPFETGNSAPLVDATRMKPSQPYFLGSRDAFTGAPGAAPVSLVSAPIFVTGSQVPLIELSQVPAGARSGAPIFNTEGQVVGLISTQWRSGGPTAIPCNMAGQLRGVTGLSHLLTDTFNSWQANAPG